MTSANYGTVRLASETKICHHITHTIVQREVRR